MLHFKIILTSVFILKISFAQLDPDLIVDFLNMKHLQFGYIFDCSDISERIRLFKLLMDRGIRTSITDMQNNSTTETVISELKYHCGIVVDGNCENAAEVLRKFGDHQLFAYSQHWLITTSDKTILEVLEQVNLNINTDLQVIITDPELDINKYNNLTVLDVYNQAFRFEGKLKVRNIGIYDSEKGFQIEISDKDKHGLRRNMTGTVFPTQMVVTRPYPGPFEDYLNTEKHSDVDTLARYFYNLNNLCKDYYNLSLQISVINAWGREVAPGKYDGLMGSVQNQEIEFAYTGLSVLKERRVDVASFGAGFWKARVNFLFRHPFSKSSTEVFLRPMTTGVWIATLAISFLLLFVLKCVCKTEAKISTTSDTLFEKSWSYLGLFVFGSICQQGSDQTSTLPSSRIITLCLFFFCIMLYQFYSGSVVSSLLTKPPITIKTLEDLVNSNLELGMEDAIFNHAFYFETKNPLHKRIYEEFIYKDNKSRVIPFHEGLQKVEKGGFAFEAQTTEAFRVIEKTFSNDAICDLCDIPIQPEYVELIAFPKKSHFRDMLNYCILRTGEHGLSSYLISHWDADRPHCLESLQNKFYQVAVDEMYTAFAVLGLGMVCSLIIFTFEVGIAKRKESLVQPYTD